MKLSEYISKLQVIIRQHGDLECVKWIVNDDLGSTSEGWYEKYEGDGTEFISDYACTYIDRGGNKQFSDINQKGYINCKQERVFEIN